MIKMFIGDQEVYCKSEFELSEEMLQTSSITLNNVYPVEWEKNHDYISRFYYPKDYSKFRLLKAKDSTDAKIYGYCRQNGTPSPDNPVQIETFTGEQDAEVEGKTYHLSLGDLELCSIGDYKDYIYYKDNKWWKHKEIEVQHINGEFLMSYETGLFEIHAYREKDYLKVNEAYCNYFEYQNVQSGLNANLQDLHFSIQNSYGNNLFIKYLKYDNPADFNNWVNSIDLKIYAILSKPIEEEITDTTLISQLNEITMQLIFAGIVKNSGDLDLNPRHPHYATIQVLDFKTLLSEGEYLDFVISNKTVREAIEMVVEAIQDYGVVAGNININGADDIIGAYSCSEKSAYDVFQYLADITNSKWTTRMIDEDTIAVDFYDPNLLPKGEAIDYTSEWFNKNQIVDMHYSYGTRDYRNKQTMLSDEVFGNVSQQERLFADGYKTNYITEQKIGKINSIKVNGTNQTFTTNNQKDLGVSADFYFTQKEKQFTSDKILKAGDRVEISYLPIVNGREIVTNEVERLRVEKSLGRKGTIARYEKRNDVSSSQELSKIGQAYIRYKGSAEINLTVQTQDNELWKIGQVVDFNNAPVDELKTSYMVKSKTTHAYVNGRQSYLFYEYELSSNFNSENAINYFDNQRNKNAGNISEGEYVLRNIDLENRTWVVFYGLEITSHEITAGDNVLNFELNGVLMK